MFCNHHTIIIQTGDGNFSLSISIQTNLIGAIEKQ